LAENVASLMQVNAISSEDQHYNLVGVHLVPPGRPDRASLELEEGIVPARMVPSLHWRPSPPQLLHSATHNARQHRVYMRRCLAAPLPEAVYPGGVLALLAGAPFTLFHNPPLAAEADVCDC